MSPKAKGIFELSQKYINDGDIDYDGESDDHYGQSGEDDDYEDDRPATKRRRLVNESVEEVNALTIGSSSSAQLNQGTNVILDN